MIGGNLSSGIRLFKKTGPGAKKFVCLFVRVITIHQPALHVSAAAPNQYTTPGPKVIKEAWNYQHDSDSRTEKNDQRKKMNKSRARVLAQRLFYYRNRS